MSTTTIKRLLNTAQQISRHSQVSHHLPPIPMTQLPEAQAEARTSSRHALRSVYMRAGTSKGLFIHRHDLPPSKKDWAPIILSAMGSRDGDQRQLNGMGGGSSTTSKVAVVKKSEREGIHVDYTFIQVAPNQAKMDMSGNCGNMVSGVGPFAVDEGLVETGAGQTEVTVRIFNTNTRRIIEETVQLDVDGKSREDGKFAMPGMQGTGNAIKVSFLNPAGSMTGKLFPTGNRQDAFAVHDARGAAAFVVRASLIDAANPFIFVDSSSLPDLYHEFGPDAPESLDLIESVRQEGAVRLGLAGTREEASSVRGTPKIAILSSPRITLGTELLSGLPDIEVTSFSMGKVHPSLQLTGAVCLAAGVAIPGTVASDLSVRSGLITPPETPQEALLPDNMFVNRDKNVVDRRISIKHRSGEVGADVRISGAMGEDPEIHGVTVLRSARRLFEGNVFFSL